MFDVKDFGNSMKPLFSYYGGKQRMASKIVKLLPPHTVYVEPFCGSGAVMFKKGLPPLGNNDYYREVLNDTSGLIVNLFRMMQEDESSDRLIRKLKYTVYSQEEYALSFRIIKNPENYSDIDRAWALWFNTTFAFNCSLGSCMKFGVFGANHASTLHNKLSVIDSFKDRLKLCYIMSEPALKCIDRWDSPQTCFYVDPPYPNADQGHYSGFSQQDFEDLLDKLKQVDGSVVLSCYDNEAVPKDWIKYEFPAHATSSSIGKTGKTRDKTQKTTNNNAKRIECVWVKPSNQMRSELIIPANNHYNHFQQLSLDYNEAKV